MKLPAAQCVGGETGRRLVWTDDDLDYVHEALHWARSQRNRVLAICPDSGSGPTPHQLAVTEA